MPDIKRDNQALPIVFPDGPEHGYVVKAPAVLGDEFEVIVPAFDDRHSLQIRRWSARGATLPALGDEVLILRDDKGEPWVPSWWPAAGDAKVEVGGGDAKYEHSQGVASKEWTIAHGLGKVPSVEAFDTTDQQIDFQLVLVDANTIILRFNIDISGRAALN